MRVTQRRFSGQCSDCVELQEARIADTCERHDPPDMADPEEPIDD
jgi:hypothetical protein